MKIHFFVIGDNNNASSRQRAYLVADELKRNNINTIIHEPPVSALTKASWIKKIKLSWLYIKIFKSINKKDVIFLQRTINKYFFVLFVIYILIFKRKIIFDIDDAVYLYSYSSYLRVKILMKMADAVIAGSYSLVKWAKRYNNNVYYVPTCIPFGLYDRYSVLKRADNNILNIGWIGKGIDHCENLELLIPVFEKLIKDNINFKFILVGSQRETKVYSLFNKVKELNVEFIDELNWRDSEEVPRVIQKFDIGLMPLMDTQWNQNKCAFKAVECMACGVSTIVSPIGENNYLISDGENGFLAGSFEEWDSKIKKLAQDHDLRSKIGNKARETIKKKYSYEAVIDIYINIIKKI